MVTMSDVAKVAGVSSMTVSNVANGRPNVSARTRERVLEVMAEMGYQMNLTARNLRAGQTNSIALVVPNFNGFFGELADFIGRMLLDSQRSLVLESTYARSDKERDAILSMSRLSMHDGAIVAVSGLSSQEIEEIRPQVPVVLMSERQMPEKFNHVRLDNVEGARMATAHLVERGARRVAMLGGSYNPEEDMAYLRRSGWEQALVEHGLEADPELVVPLYHFSATESMEAFARLVARKELDAVFCVTDIAALGALSALREAGLAVPDDVQVAGFDNMGLSRFTPPGGLTTAGPRPGALATHAIDLITRLIADPGMPPEHVTVPAVLVQGVTTRPE